MAGLAALLAWAGWLTLHRMPLFAAAGEAVSLISPLAGEDGSVVMRPCVDGPVYAWTLAHRHGALPEPLLHGIAQVVRDDYRAMATSIPALRAALGPGGPTAW